MIHFFIFAFCLFLAAPIQAEVTFAGDPEEVHIETDPGFDFPDIYQRQLAYRESLLPLRAELKERQENFAAPSREVRQNYEEDLKALHQSIQNE